MKLKTSAELEYEAKYGGKTDEEMNEIVGGMLKAKFDERGSRAMRERTEREAKYNLPYAGLVKAVAKAGMQVEALEGKPTELLSAKRKALEAEYADLIKRGMEDNNKELWISQELVKYMQDPEGEYREVKSQLQQAKTDLDIFLERKKIWEQDNADIIDAERMRTRRAELMQADPEALRALGIEPEAVSTPVAGTKADDGKGALREALKSIHPFATNEEIENMVKLV